MARAGKTKLTEYLADHLEAYLTLGIKLGAEDFDKKMEALKYICEYYHNQKLTQEK